MIDDFSCLRFYCPSVEIASSYGSRSCYWIWLRYYLLCKTVSAGYIPSGVECEADLSRVQYSMLHWLEMAPKDDRAWIFNCLRSNCELRKRPAYWLPLKFLTVGEKALGSSFYLRLGFEYLAYYVSAYFGLNGDKIYILLTQDIILNIRNLLSRLYYWNRHTQFTSIP